MTSVADKRWRWMAATVAVTFLLLLPAMYNRFPLIFPDTPTYLSVAYGEYWNVDRSGFYGLLFKPLLSWAEPVAGLWIVVTVQALLIAAVLLLTIRRIRPTGSAAGALVVILPVALLTALPWHAGQLMPDAMTGILVLVIWLAASRDLRTPGTALLWLGAGMLALVHYTHIGLMIAVTAAILVAGAWTGTARREIAGRAVVAALVLAAVAGSHVAANVTTFGRWSVSPMSSLFLFARLNEDGLVPRWLDRHCGRDAPIELCGLREDMPRDSQVMLWGGPKSPLTPHIHNRIGQAESWRWIEMLDQAATGSIKEEPLAFLGFSVRAGARQFVSFAALDDECPEICRQSMIELARFRPELGPLANESRQLRGEIPREPIQRVTSAMALVGLLLLLPFFAFAIRRRDGEAIVLLVTVVAALFANALMTGALSDVHDRYQSRLIWLAPFVLLALVVRWKMFRLRRDQWRSTRQAVAHLRATGTARTDPQAGSAISATSRSRQSRVP